MNYFDKDLTSVRHFVPFILSILKLTNILGGTARAKLFQEVIFSGCSNTKQIRALISDETRIEAVNNYFLVVIKVGKEQSDRWRLSSFSDH